MRPLACLTLALAATLLAGGADARTARDLTARMRIDGYSSEFVPAEEDVFGLTAAGVAQEARDDSKWQNNEVYQIHVTWDAKFLYVAVDAKIWGNNVVLFFDTLPNDGLTAMTGLTSWRRNVTFDPFGRFPGDEFKPDVFGATWDTGTDPRLLTRMPSGDVLDTRIGADFSAAATFDQGNDGRSLEMAIPWRNVFGGLGGGGTTATPVLINGVVDTLPRMPTGVRAIKIAALVTGSWDGSGGPDSAPDNLRGHKDDGNDMVVLDNYAIVELDQIDDTGLGGGNPDGFPDWDISPADRVAFRYPPPIVPLRFSISELTFDRPAFKPDFGDAVRYRLKLRPELDPADPLDVARTVTLTAKVYDAEGRWVRDLTPSAGVTVFALDVNDALERSGGARWDGRDAAGRLVNPGIYVVRVAIETNLARATRAVVVVR